MNWKPGDMAEILPHEYGTIPAGTIVELIEFIGDASVTHGNHKIGDAWVLDLPAPSGLRSAASEQVLGPIRDGNQKTSWGQCIFKPKDLVLIEQE